MKPIFRLLCSVLMGVTLLSSCTKDHSGIDPAPEGDLNVILKLDLPGGFIPAGSKSLTIAQENAVEDLTVLVFDHTNSLSDIKQAQFVSGTTWKVTVAQSVDEGAGNPTFNLVLVANAQSLITNGNLGFTDFRNITGAIGKSEAEVRAAVLRYVDAKMYKGSEAKAIPMWGQTGQGVIDRRNPTRSVKLIRSLARVDVGVGTPGGSAATGFSWDGILPDGAKFTLQEVYVMQPNQYISVLPNSANINSSNVATAVSLPANLNNGQWNVAISRSTFGYDVTAGGTNYITQEIYVPESDIQKGSSALGGTNHENRMAIVVGGSYMGGARTYYRLDFAKDNALMDVLRNHIYQFNITKVAGPGYASPEEAYKSLAMNMTAEVVEWDVPTIGDIVFDGQYHFGIESRTVVLPAAASSRTLAVTSSQNWAITGNSTFTYSPLNGTPANGSLTISAAANGGATRSETVTITAGRNKIQLTVTQMGSRTLSFDSQGGTAVGDLTVGGGTAGNAIGWPAAPTLTGKKFAGWYTALADPSTRADGNPQWTMPDDNTTVYARWVDGATPTVVFDMQGGIGGTLTVTGTSGSAMPAATKPTRGSDIFEGYYTGVNGTGIRYYNADMSSAQNWNFTASTTTLYAHYTNVYTVTFIGNGARGGSMSTQNFTSGVAKALTANGFTRTSHTFAGWSTSPDGSVIYANNANYTATANITFYAKWSGPTYVLGDFWPDPSNKSTAEGVVVITDGVKGTMMDLVNNYYPKWSAEYFFTGATYINVGEHNYSTIVTSRDLTLYPPMQFCQDKIPRRAWHLPAINDVLWINTNILRINARLAANAAPISMELHWNVFYGSSTEVDINNYYAHFTSAGTMLRNALDKGTTDGFYRCVRRF